MKNKKLFAILTLVCFMFTLIPVAAFADGETVTVVTTEQLKAKLSEFGSAGAGSNTVIIGENLELAEGETWEPVVVDGYNGADVITIEGNGHTISGLNAPLFSGGFAGGSGIVIKDLTIKDSTIVSENELGSGAFIETVDSMDVITLSNCHLVDSSVNGSRTGGLIGWTSGYDNTNDGAVKTYVTIKDCSVINCNITGNGTVGGINGHAGANPWTFTTIEDCTVENCTLISYDDSYRVGVVLGTANVGEVIIKNIVSSGNTLKQIDGEEEIPRTEGQSDLYGRFVPQNGKGELEIIEEEFVAPETVEEAPTGAPVVEISEELELDEETANAITEAAKSVNVAFDETETTVVEYTEEQLKAAEDAIKIDANVVTHGEEIKLYTQPYLDIKPTEYSTTTDEESATETKTLTLDITPMERLVASTASSADEIVLEADGENAQNAVALTDTATKKDVKKPVELSIALPAGFVESTEAELFVQHKGYEYNADLEENEDTGVITATFTNPHGFSEFTFTTKSKAVAKANGESFTTLQAAMNVVNSGTIEIVAAIDEDIEVAETTSVTLSNTTDSEIVITINGEDVKIAAGETATFSYTKPSTSTSTGGGFSGTYNYPVTAGDVDGAKVTFSDNNAVAGETVTITVTPDSGKQVDEVIVTDADGDVIPVTKTGDNTYTFTMPAGKVNVSVTTEAIDYDTKVVLQINNKNVVVNGRTITNDVAPKIVGDRTLVPIRVIVEALGGTADWDEATRTVTITIDGKVLTLVIDEMIPGFGQGAAIMDSRTYVPVRYVAEYIGANVEWIAETQQIVILK